MRMPRHSLAAHVYCYGLEDGPIKIGVSSNLPARLREGHWRNYIPCTEVLFVGDLIPWGKARALESAMHFLLREWWVAEEWFDVPASIGRVAERAVSLVAASGKLPFYGTNFRSYTGGDDHGELVKKIRDVATFRLRYGPDIVNYKEVLERGVRGLVKIKRDADWREARYVARRLAAAEPPLDAAAARDAARAALKEENADG